MFVAEDGLKLMQNDAGGIDDLFCVEEVADGWHLCLHEAGAENDAKVVLAHLALLLMRQHLFSEETE